MKYEIRNSESRKIRKRMKRHKKNVTIYNRLKAVALRGEGKTNKEIAAIVEMHEKHVSQLVSLFVKEGMKALATDGRKGGNHKNLSFEEESMILKEFEETAISGQIIVVTEIKNKYDKVLGRETKQSFIYSVLKRHGWRKVMPRSKHPKKASDEVIEASKKLTHE